MTNDDIIRAQHAKALRDMTPDEQLAEPSAQDERERFFKSERVRIVRRVDKQKGWTDTWTDLMNDCVGRQGVVKKADDRGILVIVDGRGDWSFPPDALERIDSLATAPSTRIEAEPVAVVVNNNVPGERMHLIRTVESHPTLDVGTAVYLAPPDRTPDARSTSDAAVVLPELPTRFDTVSTAAGDPRRWTDVYARFQMRAYARDAVLRDRATRSTDSSAEAVDGNALRDEFEQWYVENAFDFKRNPIGSGLCGQQWFAYAGAKGLSHAEANIVLLDRMARAEAAKLTTAPHTAAGGLPPPYDTRKVEDAYALLWASVPTRDPKPHAARQLLREHLGTIKCNAAIRRLVDSGNGPDGDAIHSALLEGATTAPHTADDTRADAARYRLLRRGQQWSVIDGIGDALRADVLDATVDAALQAEQPEGS